MDRYSAYSLLSTGSGAFVCELLYIGRQHDAQSQKTPLLIIEGGNDYYHEVVSAQKYGFLSDPNDLLAAVRFVFWYYDTYVLTHKIIGSMDAEQREAFDRCIANIQDLMKLSDGLLHASEDTARASGQEQFSVERVVDDE